MLEVALKGKIKGRASEALFTFSLASLIQILVIRSERESEKAQRLKAVGKQELIKLSWQQPCVLMQQNSVLNQSEIFLTYTLSRSNRFNLNW